MSQSLTKNRLAPARASSGGASPLGAIGSLALHGAILAAALFTWQHRFEIADEAPPVVPVELVTIADKTNIKAVAPEENFKPKEAQPLTAPPLLTPTAPPPQAAPPKIAMDAPEPAPADKPAIPKQRPEPPKQEAKKEKFDINNVLALLDKQKPAAAQAHGAAGAQPHRGFGAQNAMTMDLVDALRNEIAQCWSPPVGAPRASDLVVVYDLYLNPDGSVARAPQLSASTATGNPFTQAAAEAARRAIYECAPYKLPANRYNDWRSIEIQFDPRQMMGEK